MEMFKIQLKCVYLQQIMYLKNKPIAIKLKILNNNYY